MVTLKVRFDGKVLIPQEPVSFPIDRDLQCQVTDEGTGSGSAILAVLTAGPHLPSEWVDEMEQAIADGQSPVDANGEFDDVDESGR